MKALAPLAILLLAAPVQAAKVATPPVFTLRTSDNGNPYLPVMVKNATLNIRMALSFDQGLVLNEPAAARAGLKPCPLIGKGSFSNAMIPGGKATFRFNLPR